MPSSWYTQFTKGLNDYQRAAAVRVAEDDNGLNDWSQLPSLDLDGGDNGNSGSTGDNGVNEWSQLPNLNLGNPSHISDSNWDRLKSFGGSVLDNIARTGYASGAALNDIHEDILNNIDNKPANNVNPFDAFKEGLNLDRKEFFHPYATSNPYHDGESWMETAGRFGGDFVASVLTDPLTYVPVGFIGSMLGRGARATGLAGAAQKAVRPKAKLEFRYPEGAEPPKVADDATGAAAVPEPEVAPAFGVPDPGPSFDVPIPGATPAAPIISSGKVSETAPEVAPIPSPAGTQPQESDFIRELINPPASPAGVPAGALADTALKTTDYAPDAASSALIQHLLDGGRSNSVNGTDLRGRLYAANAVRAKLNDTLAAVRGRLYGPNDFDNPWKDLEVAKTDAKLPEPIEPKFDTLAPPTARPVRAQEKITQHVIVRSLIDSAEHGEEAALLAKSEKNPGKLYYATDTDKIVVSGKVRSAYDWANKYSKDGIKGLKAFVKNNPDVRINLFRNSDESIMPYHLERYAQALAGSNKVSTNELLGYTISKNGEGINLLDYTQESRAKWKAAEKGPGTVNPTEQAAYEAEMGRRMAAKSEYEKARRAYKDQELGINQTKTERIKPSAEGRRAWLTTHADKLTDADKRRLSNLLNLGKEKPFLKALDDIMHREGNIDVQTVSALKDAVKSGRVPAEEGQKILESMGFKTYKEAGDRIEALNRQIERLEKGGARLDDVIQGNKPDFSMAARYPVPSVHPMELKNVKPGTPLATKTMGSIVHEVSDVPVEALSPEILDILTEGLKNTVKIEFEQGRKVNVHSRKSPGATGSTPEVYGGSARYLEEFNQKSQLTGWKQFINAVKKTVPKTPEGKFTKFGDKHGEHMYERMMPALQASDDVYRAYNIHPALQVGGKGIPLSIYDILSSLPKQWVVRHVFNVGSAKTGGGRQVTITQLMHFAEESLSQTPGELSDYVNMMIREGTDLPNLTAEEKLKNSAAGYAENMGTGAYKKAEKRFKEKYPDHMPEQSDISSWHRQAASAEIRYMDETLGPFASMEFRDGIAQALERNRATAGMQAETFVKKAEYEAVSKLVNDVADAATNSEVFSIVKNARKGVAGMIKDTNTMVPPPGGVNYIEDSVGATAHLNVTTEMAAQAAKRYEYAATNNERVRVGMEAEKAQDDMIDHMVDVDPDAFKGMELTVTNFGNHRLEYRTFLKMEVGPIIRGIAAFNPHAGEQLARDIWLSVAGHANSQSAHFTQKLTEFQRKTGTNANSAIVLKAVQHGGPVAPENVEAVHFLQKIMDEIFDTTGGKDGFLHHQGIDPDLVNEHLAHFGLDKTKYGLNGATREEAYQSWRNWPEHSDPIDLLSKMFHAINRAHAEQTFGAHLSHRLGSATNEGGRLVKIPKNVQGSRISKLIDTSLWYEKETAENLLAADHTLRDLAKPPNQSELLRILDGFTHWYKTALTLPRPGHHLRNMYGDIVLGFMDGVDRPRYYNQGRKTLAARGEYYDDLVLDVRIGDLRYSPENTAISMRTPDGAHEIHLTHRDVNSLGVTSGLFPSYGSFEGFKNAIESGVNTKRTLRRPFKGAVMDQATKATEYRDHLPRAAHLWMLLEKDRNKLILGKRLPNETEEAWVRRSLEYQFQRYATRVRKWHPDGTDLSHFEKNVMRRSVLFYSWISRVMPRVVESMATRPGRFMVFPKATYAMAEAQGIDLNGLGDPFPRNHLFPAWMGDIQGPTFGGPSPVGGYMGLRPGIPTVDLLDQYFDNPGRTASSVMSSLHPAMKIPFETMAGKALSGIPIKSIPEYLIGQVPFGQQANTTIGAFRSGDKPIGDSSPTNVYYDKHASGMQNPAVISWFNFLTGLGLMDMDKPSYDKAAEFDIKYGRL